MFIRKITYPSRFDGDVKLFLTSFLFKDGFNFMREKVFALSDKAWVSNGTMGCFAEQCEAEQKSKAEHHNNNDSSKQNNDDAT